MMRGNLKKIIAHLMAAALISPQALYPVAAYGVERVNGETVFAEYEESICDDAETGSIVSGAESAAADNDVPGAESAAADSDVSAAGSDVSGAYSDVSAAEGGEKNQEAEVSGSDGGTLYGGFMPDTLPSAFSTGDIPGSAADDGEAEVDGAYESRYSSQDNGYVSAVVDQGDSQLCWAFSAAACMEINAVKKGYMDAGTHLSADALGYFFYNRVADPLSLTDGVKVRAVRSGAETYYDNGGNPVNTVFELMQWLGPVYEEDAPFEDTPKTYADDMAYDHDALHLEQAVWTASGDVNGIKAMIREYGAAAVSVSLDRNAYETVSYNGAQVKSLYNNARENPNHAVTIVGWDDDFPADSFSGTSNSRRKPEEDGAWICKNSYSDAPFFYLSYEDASLTSTSYNNKAIAFDVGANDGFKHNYGYDGGIGTGGAARDAVIYGAEVYCAAANPGELTAENIRAVSFGTNTPGASYEINIYTEVDPAAADPTAGVLKKTVKSTMPLFSAGYHTVRLEDPVYVNEGEYYSVVVKLTAPAASRSEAVFLYDDLYGSGLGSWVESDPCARTGRSYLSADGKKWTDSASGEDMSDFRYAASGHTPTAGYVRIKAYTDDTAAAGQYYIDSDMVALIPDQTYTGETLTPDPQIYYEFKRLEKDRDYKVTYGANRAVGKGTGTVTITGCGRYATVSSIVRTFNIKKRSLSDPYVEIGGLTDQIYTGAELEPVTVSYNGITLRKNADYVIKYLKNDRTGLARAIIKGKGSFYGTRKVTFNVERRDVADESIVAKEIKTQDYTGEPVEPAVTLTGSMGGRIRLEEGKDFTAEYFDNIIPGTAKVLIMGIGNYSGSRIVEFEIKGADLSKANVSNISDAVFTGEAIAPEVTVYYGNKKLTESVDYEVNYINNIDVGTATVSISGRKGTIYAGTGITKSFNIRAAGIANATLENFGDVTYRAGVRYYTQNEKRNDPNRMKVRLPGGYYLDPSEYTVSYSGNYSSGSTVTASVTIKAVGGNVTGTLTKEFSIVATSKILLNDFSGSDLVVEGFPATREFIYDASNHRTNADNSTRPNVTVSYRGVPLVKDRDYTVSYHNNLGKGHAYLTIEAVPGSDYTGERIEYFDIIGKPIYVTSLAVADNDFYSKGPADCVYDGSPQRPEIVIFEKVLRDKSDNNTSGEGVKRLREDVDYILKYRKNVDAGVASVYLTGIGDYSGEYTFTFNIEPADMSAVEYSAPKSVYYSGQEVKPEIYLKNKGGFLMDGVDYDVSYGENINAGTGSVIYTAKELTAAEKAAGMVPNYVGQLTVPFAIKSRSLADKNTIKVLGLEDVRYQGSGVTPAVSLVMNTGFSDVLVPESEYVVSYGSNSTAGRGKLVIKARPVSEGGSGNYTGSRAVSFAIAGADFAVNREVLDSFKTPYNRSRAKLSVPVIQSVRGTLSQGTDYQIKTDGRKDAGFGTYSLIGKGEFKGSYAYGIFEVTPLEVGEADIAVKNIKSAKLVSAASPARCAGMKVLAEGRKLKKGKDYVVTYSNNTAAGSGLMYISLVNNYSGQVAVPFAIE